ncbi:MAG TPA: hypothetical protein VFQ54_11780, partial [Thermomicrobiales bacterium]|nr:hypothetical protein [Thermomicrobiales bacterium]
MTDTLDSPAASPGPQAQAQPQPLDEISQAYVALAFGLDRHIPGAIDGYMGPDALRPDPDAPAPEPAFLLAQAEALLAGIERADLPPARVDYLLAQATGMATMCRKLVGEEIAYEDEVKLYFDVSPERTPESAYTEAIAALEDALPGDGTIGERMIAWRKQYEIPVEAAKGIVPVIVDEIRRRTFAFAALPDGEAVELSFVQDKPWSGYNWYLGSNRSLIEINTDLPIKANALLDLMCHEGYPGHHTEHSLKEQLLYRDRGYGEHSILM